MLAGPNGAGKTRILRAIQSHLSHEGRDPNELQFLPMMLEEHDRAQGQYQHPDVERWRAFLEAARCVEVEGEFQRGRVFEFLPKHPVLADHREKDEAAWKREESSLKCTPGLESVAAQTMAYLVRIARRAFSAAHPESTASPAEREEVLIENHLYDLIEQLLGTRPRLDLDQQPILFGHPIPDSNAQLSDGQSLLLQMAVGCTPRGPL